MDPRREVRVSPARDWRSQDAGITSAKIVFALTDGKHAVTFSVSLGWYLKQTDRTALNRNDEFYGIAPCDVREPDGYGIDYHDTKPHYEGQTRIPECEWTGGECYCDGSGLGARDLLRRLIAEGDSAVWAELQEWWDAHIAVRAS